MKKHDWRLDFIKIVAIIFVLYNLCIVIVLFSHMI